MTNWEKKIINEFISHYFDSVPETGEARSVLRVRSSMLFPNFDASRPDEKESYLEAAESLQQKGIINLNWEKRSKGERLKTLSCENFEKLFEEAGRSYPKTEAENIRAMLGEKVQFFKEAAVNPSILKCAPPGRDPVQAMEIIGFLEYLSQHFGPREIGQGIDQHTMEDFIRLLEFCSGPAKKEKLTTRALSILLYRDSKHLENLLALCGPLLSCGQKHKTVPDLSFLERSYPETMIAGKIFFIFKEKYKKDKKNNSFFNDNAFLFGFPLETVEMIDGIGYMSGKDKSYVLTIENKETFYALARPQNRGTSELLSMFDCFLYVGGYSNRAAAAMIKILAVSNFTFYHAGDLDPDGILILQHIQELAGRPVTPLRMNAATFDQYQDWARPLSKPMLRQIAKIRDETRANPELAGLLRRIEETGMGVEQEIIDYRLKR
jgi:hypothetical protein